MIFIFPKGWYGVCEIEFSQMSKIGGNPDLVCKNIRIYHECEGRIEKSVSRIIVWHHEACRVMTNIDPEGRIFLSYSHPNNRFFFLLTTKKRFPELPEYTKMPHVMMTSL